MPTSDKSKESKIKYLQSFSSADLIKRCSQDTDATLWEVFVNRVHRQILQFIIREVRSKGFAHDEAQVVEELSQKVYLHLLAKNRRALREFHGDSEPAVFFFLKRIVRNVTISNLQKTTARGDALFEESFDYESEQLLRKSAFLVSKIFFNH